VVRGCLARGTACSQRGTVRSNPNGIRTKLSASLRFSLSLIGFLGVVQFAFDLQLLALTASIWQTMAGPHRTPDKGEVDGSVHLGSLNVSPK
jgi:hypothetical protein